MDIFQSDLVSPRFFYKYFQLEIVFYNLEVLFEITLRAAILIFKILCSRYLQFQHTKIFTGITLCCRTIIFKVLLREQSRKECFLSFQTKLRRNQDTIHHV